jgi:flagellar biosynthesis/type III secretory pathway protein FliH
MKVNKIIMKMYKAIIDKDIKLEKKLWFKALKKSLKSKKTQVIK